MPPIDLNDPEVKKEVDALIGKAVSTAVGDLEGIKDKNRQLLDEKKSLSEKLKAFDGLNVDEIRSLRSRLENDEEAKLIAAGKIDEVLNKRFEKLRTDYDGKISSLSEAQKKLTEERDQYKTKYSSSKIETALRAAAEKAKVIPEAIDDVILRGSGMFSLDDDGDIVRRGADGKLITTEDGKKYSPEVFIEELKPKAPHYWRGSKSGGFGGDEGGDGESDSLTKKMMAAADSGNMKEYRRLRELKAKRDAEKS